MLSSFIQLFFFTAKALIIVLLILFLIAGIIMLVTRGRERLDGRFTLRHINEKYLQTTEDLLQEILPKKEFKQFYKEKRAEEKKKKSDTTPKKNIFILNFDGDIKASAVDALREEVTALLGIAKPTDEIVVCVESGGGMVHAYGLAAAQLQRFRQQHIPLTVIVDKVAASGGYLMASVANKLLAAPFAVIGSIGVIVQLPNFHRLLKEKHIDFEQLTAGTFKRTLTMFGHNTSEGRDKMQQEIEEIHTLFQDAILIHRKGLDMEKVATGEHWLGTQALELKLVDGISTSDDYLLEQSKTADLYELSYHTKKSLAEKLGAGVSILKNKIFAPNIF